MDSFRVIMGIKQLFIFILSTILIFIIYYTCVKNFVARGSEGIFGDMFGGLTSLFSCLAFFGLIYTIGQQNKLIKQNTEQINYNKIQFDTERKMQAFTVLITLYESKYSSLKDKDPIKANEYKSKVTKLSNELEEFLTR
jgi:L-lactate permease